ncbi:hypothetical protein [Brachybacterium epidermidis]|uniref:hypothetical protein n=1 Tax=Brachybacterium epidermidis TaxID=2781983 RepID=UPI00398F890F
MKISIDTDLDSFSDAVRAVHAAYGVIYGDLDTAGDDDSANADIAYEDGDDGDYLPGRWTRKRIQKLAQWVHGGDADIALRFIAEHAPAVDLDEVFEHMEKQTGINGFTGKHMGGRMSAVGFARNHIGGGVGHIYDTDYGRRKYRMDERIARVLLEELEALG